MNAWLRSTFALLLAVVACTLVLASQGGKKPRKEEEEDPPAKKEPGKKREEEERPPRPDSSRVLDIDDEPKEKRPAPRPAGGSLATLAKSERDPESQALFERLAVPADTLTLRLDVSTGRITELRVQPIAVFVAEGKRPMAPLTVRPAGKDEAEKDLPPDAVRKVRYYEQEAAEAVKAFMERASTPRYARFIAAEAALSAVLRFHQSAVQLGTRAGADWYPMEARLRRLLVEALLGQMDSLVESKAWKAAFDLTDRLAEAAPRSTDPDNELVVKKVSEFLGKALKDRTWFTSVAEIRERMKRLDDLFPGRGVGKPIANTLRDDAARLLEDARRLVKEGKKDAAINVLREAVDAWPALEGLREFQAAIDRTYQVLRVGVKGELRMLSPARAATDAELRALDLMFEGLVQLVPDEEGRLYYVPQLAEGRPEVLPLGRRFRLPAGASWSNGTPVNAGDVRATVRWMKGAESGRMQILADLLADPEMASVSSRVGLRLGQGFLDPLSLMAFKVLPANRIRDEDKFARNPVGSGPFRFMGEKADPAGSYVSFVANPGYGMRKGRSGQPRLSEVRFSTPADPVKELSSGKIDLAMDLTGKEAGDLEDRGYEVRKPGTSNRRIYFLAVNNKLPGLKEAGLRLALAHAIPREAILDGVFRKGLKTRAHAALNGPYPVGSWACDPSLSPKGKPSVDPFDPDLARAKFKEALTRTGRKDLGLKLSYPRGDKQVEDAMEELTRQAMRAVPNLVLTPESVPPADFRKKVESGDYELAYYHYDFPEGAFWLGPLLSATPSGENFLNYHGPMDGKVTEAMKVRHFPEVRKRAQEIHRLLLLTEMPFIPLWQLDPLMASKKGLIDAPPFEAHHPFARIGEWRVKRGD